ncbi:MAG: nitroreductase family deazaflavin-dependent oxidoreductase [Anaerolineae bacterium]|nr:nitroreductase family deazaflavin-dependent oxidoreductase [Anaerolineae bacterium]
MTAMDRETQAALQQGFKYLNRYMVLMWRLGLGKWLNSAPTLLGRYMVIVNVGRKSGQKRFAPVNYALADGQVYCVAGFGAGSHWYQNIMATPQVELWLPDGRWSAQAVDVTASDDASAKIRQVLIASAFVAPLVGIDPHTMPDAELAAATADYRLIRFERGGSITGTNGPGELAWVWPLLGLVLLLALRGQKRRK